MSGRKSERLLNLLIALLVARGYVTKARLREVIPDYRNARNEDAFEKMFERDKDDLRGLGVPIETGGHDPLFGDEPGYRIERSTFELPDIALSADEAAVVGLAARVWQHVGLATATSDALRKLVAGGVEVDRTALDVVQPVLVAEEACFGAIWEAVATRRAVRFDYLGSRDVVPARRDVQPWGIVSYRSRWYVVGHDVTRGEPRMFRLSRVQGEVTFAGPPQAYAVPEGTDLRALAGALAPEVRERTAVLLVRDGRALSLRRRAASVTPTRDGWDRVEVPFGGVGLMAGEVLALGDDVVVEAPTELREHVVSTLRSVAGGAA